MKSLIKIILCLFFIAALSGCATVTAGKTEYKFVRVPKTMTLPCIDPAPPAYATFLTLSVDQRIDALSNRSFSQSTVLVTCNNQLKAINEWSDKQETVFNKKDGQKDTLKDSVTSVTTPAVVPATTGSGK